MYSALDRLERGLGRSQPWLGLPSRELDRLWRTEPFDLLLLDIAVPDEHQRSDAE